MNVLEIARIAHEVNRAYCAAIGDTQPPPWDEAPVWQKESILAGVEAHLANPHLTPYESHQLWLERKVSEGWKWGKEKDTTLKTHPCCLPFWELPSEQRVKDFLFSVVVAQLRSQLR